MLRIKWFLLGMVILLIPLPCFFVTIVLSQDWDAHPYRVTFLATFLLLLEWLLVVRCYLFCLIVARNRRVEKYLYEHYVSEIQKLICKSSREKNAEEFANHLQTLSWLRQGFVRDYGGITSPARRQELMDLFFTVSSIIRADRGALWEKDFKKRHPSDEVL